MLTFPSLVLGNAGVISLIQFGNIHYCHFWTVVIEAILLSCPENNFIPGEKHRKPANYYLLIVYLTCSRTLGIRPALLQVFRAFVLLVLPCPGHHGFRIAINSTSKHGSLPYICRGIHLSLPYPDGREHWGREREIHNEIHKKNHRLERSMRKQTVREGQFTEPRQDGRVTETGINSQHLFQTPWFAKLRSCRKILH